MLSGQIFVYFVSRLFLKGVPLHDLSTALDLRIPFVPAWVTVYFLSYPFWAVNSVWMLSESPEHAVRCTVAFLLALLLTALCFFAWPGTIVRPEPVGDGFFERWVRLLYRIDSPTNLCPSMHVLDSYLCWRGTCGCRGIPKGYKWFSFVFMLLVCPCILFVKQHAIIDIPVALIIAELCYQAGMKWLPLPHRMRQINDRNE